MPEAKEFVCNEKGFYRFIKRDGRIHVEHRIWVADPKDEANPRKRADGFSFVPLNEVPEAILAQARKEFLDLGSPPGWFDTNLAD